MIKREIRTKVINFRLGNTDGIYHQRMGWDQVERREMDPEELTFRHQRGGGEKPECSVL